MTPEQVAELVRQLLSQNQPTGSGVSRATLRKLERKLSTPIPIGNMAMTGNLAGVETVNPGVGTFVPVGNGTGVAHPLFVANPQNKNFVLVGATAETQALRYVNTRSFKLCIRGILAVQNQALVAQGFALRLLQNGVPVPNTTIESQTGGLIDSAGALVTESLVMASPNDLFTLEFANLTSGADLTVSSAVLTVGAAQ